MEEANKLIGTGKRHLVMGKAVEAVSALQEACGMLAKKYGDTADECGEAFFWCGKALLDLARMENSVLGNALEGVPEEEEEEEKDSNVDSTENIDEKTRDELRVQVYDAMAEKKSEDAEKKSEDVEKKSEDVEKKSEDVEKKSEDAEKKSEDVEKVKEKPSGDKEKNGDVEKPGDEPQKAAEKDEEKHSVANGGKSDKSEEKTENDKEAEKESGDKEEEAEDGEEEEEGEDGDDAEMECDAEEQGDGAAEKDSDDEEEVGNLQLAWEMLEVAKVIYRRKETKEDQLMAAQTHLKLGEVSSESGNYTQALEDFQECLKLQVKHLDSDSRLLAETHYQLGVTYSLNLQYSEAIEALKSSISVIKSRLDKLQGLIDQAEGPEALPAERKEMEELKALLPDIQEKVEDAAESLKMMNAAAETAKAALDGGSTSSGFPGSTAQNGDSSCSSKINGTSTNGVSSTNGHASTAPVSDISHLVRKKRKPEESPVKEGVVKKVKQNDGQPNGVHEANGDTNGHAESTEVKSQ